MAGITISTLLGENGIIQKAKEAKEKTEQDAVNTQQYLQNLEDQMNDALGIVKIPEGLEVGATVAYNPSGEYKWQAAYCSSIKIPGTDTALNDDVILKSGKKASGEAEDFAITSWKVLSIDETTGRVELVPSAPTTGTVYLGEAQGYNNGVKLLNDACSSLYGDNEKGISARSINIEDIEKYMTNTAKEEVHGYINTVSNTVYGGQISSAYTTSNSNYPVIYAQEKLSVIDGNSNGDTGLGLSDTPNNFIERTENGATSGILTPTTSIQPYQTNWYKDSTYMETAFKPFDEQNADKGNYYSLIMPTGTSTTYWVASRCVRADSECGYFYVRSVNSGDVYAKKVYRSKNYTYSYSLAIFPVVTLNSRLISGDTTNFRVQ